MDANEMQRLAAVGAVLRPDWPTRSLLTFLERHFAARAYGDVAVALTWVATRTKTETPRLLLEAGPWWKAAATESAHVPRPPRRDEECPTHAGSWRDSCTGCASDRLAGTTTDEPNYRKGVALSHLTQARAELAAVRARCCSHGVERGRCREDHPTEIEETQP